MPLGVQNQSVVVVNTTVDQIWDWRQQLYRMAPSLFVCKLPSEEVPNTFPLTTMQENVPLMEQLPSIIVRYTRTQITIYICSVSDVPFMQLQ